MKSKLLVTVIVTVIFLVALILVLLPQRAARPAGDAAAPHTPAGAPPPAASSPAAREPGTPASANPQPVRPATARDFDAVFGELLQALVPPGARPPETPEGVAQAEARQARVRELVTEILITFPDSGARGFQRLSALAAPWQSEPVRREALAAGMVVDFSLQTMQDRAERRREVAELVLGMLHAMRASNDLATSVRAMLVDKAYLGRDHEPTLLSLAAEAKDELAYLRGPVRDLLITLWRNIGSADPDALLRDLLLYFGDEHGGALAEAAMHRLLQDERYRAMVLAQLIAGRDVARLRSAAQFAVKNLPFAAAMDIVRSLQCGVPDVRQIGAYSWLSVGNAADLRAEYERCLADGTMPIHRELLVMSAGNAPPPGRAAGIACATTALAHDPSPAVRGVAFLALCNQGAVAEAQGALLSAMGDPAFTSRYRIPYLIDGLEALAQRADRDLNFLDQATTFLRLHANQADKARLEQLRTTHLPH